MRDAWVFWGLLALLVWAPLPLGSNRTFAIGILVFWVFVLLAGALWAWRGQADAAWQRVALFKWPLMMLGAFVLLVWFQTLQLPEAWVKALSPEAWRVLDGVAPFRLSLDVFQTRIYAALSTGYFCAFLLVLLTVRDRARLDQLAMGLVVAGVLQAVLAVMLFSATAHYQIYFFDVLHDRTKGSFGYHNHFAGYMELCLSVGVGLMLARLGNDHSQGSGWKHVVGRMLQFVLSPKMRLRMLLVVMVIALVLTRSRMGNAGFFAALVVVGLIALALTRRSAPAMVTLIISLIVVDVVVVGSWVGLEKVVNRVQETAATIDGGGAEESIEQRQQAAMAALDLVRDFPLFGTGGGSFYGSFMRYRATDKVYFDHAHNDYVELAADYGLVGLGLLGAFVLVTFYAAARTLAKRRTSLPRGIAFGVMMAIVSIAIHSWVDFNLQLPANVLTLMVILAMGWVAYTLPSGRHTGEH
ncbi:O-antigen ligase family protein [Curvibacter sp. HBC61]|uniref:O-antigen ligase family protein n=1 Tax=Curvibacter cyanobacteriorum TaxID=3026422 RepID=A0ABT5N3G5_9BURK|nr:O-antigen ligase family protein [Curvibacter sp. HBC61]MDD0840859.1 O-antigen ligase family protein [Curvibacter sp. HBC61]